LSSIAIDEYTKKKGSYHALVKYVTAAEKTTEVKFRWNKDELM
jgi:hypothetical protein